jgi:predicted  nucleic acid-binding Zn-ribbon protein
MRLIIRLVVLLAGIALARELWSRHVQVVAATQDLDRKRADIEAAESAIDVLDHSIDQSEARLRELSSDISAIERRYPAGIPEAVYPEYSRLVAEHNDAVTRHNDLVTRQGELQGTYAMRVEDHNARVAAANSLATVSTTCAMLPEWLRRSACQTRE